MFKQFIVIALAAFAVASAFAADINRATQAELEAIKGIGPTLSTRILDARKQGDFKSWADLGSRVSGVAGKTAAKFSSGGLTVNGAAYDGSAPAKSSQGKKAKAGTDKTAVDKAEPAKRAKAM